VYNTTVDKQLLGYAPEPSMFICDRKFNHGDRFRVARRKIHVQKLFTSKDFSMYGSQGEKGGTGGSSTKG
jgi:hypothetical protein